MTLRIIIPLKKLTTQQLATILKNCIDAYILRLEETISIPIYCLDNEKIRETIRQILEKERKQEKELS